jgi:hypothetical protein
MVRYEGLTFPAKNVKVGLYESDIDTTGKTAILPFGVSVTTDEKGQYNFSLIRTDTYMAIAERKPYKDEEFIEVFPDEGTEINFIFYISEERFRVEQSIVSGELGGEIFISQTEQNGKTVSDNITYEHQITIYNSVNINPVEINQNTISIIVSGDDDIPGKTIAITIDSSMFSTGEEILIDYDGETINLADDILDALDPTNDNDNSEYFIASDIDNYKILLISIPHFSEHEITIYSLIKTIEDVAEPVGGLFTLLLYIGICLIIGILIIGAIKLRRRY